MNKAILNPKQAEELQNKIYREMSARKKIEITSRLILLAKKLSESKHCRSKKSNKK